MGFATIGLGLSPVALGGAVAAPLRVTAYAAPSAGTLPLNVYLQANVSGGTGLGVSVSWAFGDGTTGTGLSLRHVFTTSGAFSVRVAVQDSAGDTANTSLRVNVSAAPANASVASDTPSAPFPLWAAAAIFAGGLGTGAVAVLVTYRISRGLGGGPSRAAPSGVTSDGPRSGAGLPAPRSADPLSVSVPPSPAFEAETVSSVSSERRERRRSSELVVLHLARLGPLRSDVVSEGERSQAGIGEALGLAQNIVSPVLRRLVQAGILESQLRHVSGQRRRLKVYSLTAVGESLARDFRRRGLSPPPNDRP